MLNEHSLSSNLRKTISERPDEHQFFLGSFLHFFFLPRELQTTQNMKGII